MPRAVIVTIDTRLQITRKVEFDAGHRIPDHKSKCRNMHGHRYVLECTIEGVPVNAVGMSDHAMIVDFGDLKTIMMDEIAGPWDHAFLVSARDQEVIDALALVHAGLPGGHKTIVLSDSPTVEVMARVAHDKIAARFLNSTMFLVHTRLYETPNCWADVYATVQEHKDGSR